MQTCGSFVSRIVKDFRQKELLPLKLLFFVHASTLFVLYPYLTIHMRELGINVEETAIMSAVTPVVAIIMPPLAGMVADKIGNFKLLLSFFSTLGGVASLLLLLVPVGRITVTYPEDTVMVLGCGDFSSDNTIYSSLDATLAEQFPCNRTSTNEEILRLTTKLEGCGFVCEANQSMKGVVPDAFTSSSSEEVEGELSIDAILKSRSYQIEMLNKVYQFNLTQEDIPQRQTKQQSLTNRFMDNEENFHTAIRRFSKNLYFLPAGDLYELSCSHADEEMIGSSDFLLSSGSRFSRMKREAENSTVCRIRQWQNESETVVPNGIPIETEFKIKSKTGPFVASSLKWGSNGVSPLCQKEDTDAWATVYLHNPDNNMEIMHEIKLQNCQPRCLLTTKRSSVCYNLEKEITYNPSLTFWVYMIIRVFIGIIGGTSFAMFEGAVIAILRDQKADYGLQRIYASIGGMISSPLSGALIDYASAGKGYTDFRPAFYLYAGLKLLGGLLMLTINLEFKTSAKNIVTDVMNVLKKIEVIALLVASFLLGTAWGYIESFLFWLLQDLGGSRSLMGITITVGGIAGIPLLALSGPIIDKIGHANVIFLGFVFYAIRLLGYSLIYNPWHCLFFEAMESITTSLAFTAAVTYAARLSTTTTDSSIQGLLGGLYFGVGKGAGSLVGGFLMKSLGTRTTFQVFAVFTAIMGCIYYCLNRFYISRLPQTGMNDICKKNSIKDQTIIPSFDVKLSECEKRPVTEAAHENQGFESDEQKKESEEMDTKSKTYGTANGTA